MDSEPPPPRRSWLILLGLLLLGAGLRCAGLDWGTGARTGLEDLDGAPLSLEESGFSPVETSEVAIAASLDGVFPAVELYGVRFPANRSGHLYTYLLAGLLRLTGGADPDSQLLVARGFSAACGLLAIVAVFLLGRACGSPWLGLAAALCLACLPLAVRTAHFAGPEALGGLLALLCLGACVAVQRSGRMLHAALAGAAAGAALASSIGLFPLLAALAAPLFGSGSGKRRAARVGCGLLLAALGFAALSPAAWLEPGAYWRGHVDLSGDGDYDDEEDIGPGSTRRHAYHFLAAFPDDLQAGRGRLHLAGVGVGYGLFSHLPALLGWPAMLASLAGLGLLCWRRRAWPVALFALGSVGLALCLPLHPLAPWELLAPTLALALGELVLRLVRLGPGGRLLAALLGLHLLLCACAIAGVYLRPDTRALALRTAEEGYRGAMVVTERGPNGLLEALPAQLMPAARQLDIRQLSLNFAGRYTDEALDLSMVTGLSRVGEVGDEAVERAVEHPDWQEGTRLLSEILIEAGELSPAVVQKCRASYVAASNKRRETDLLATVTGVSEGELPRTIADHLAQGQLLVFSADRYAARGSFALAARYYRELFEEDVRYAVDGGSVTGNLYGLREVAVFASPPELFGLPVGLSAGGPEVWRYDRPTVWLFARVARPKLTSYSYDRR